MDGEGSGTDAQKPNAPVEAVAETAATEELNTPSEGAPERREDEEGTPRSEKKEKEKEDKPRSLAAFKVCLCYLFTMQMFIELLLHFFFFLFVFKYILLYFSVSLTA